MSFSHMDWPPQSLELNLIVAKLDALEKALRIGPAPRSSIQDLGKISVIGAKHSQHYSLCPFFPLSSVRFDFVAPSTTVVASEGFAKIANLI